MWLEDFAEIEIGEKGGHDCLTQHVELQGGLLSSHISECGPRISTNHQDGRTLWRDPQLHGNGASVCELSHPKRHAPCSLRISVQSPWKHYPSIPRSLWVRSLLVVVVILNLKSGPLCKESHSGEYCPTPRCGKRFAILTMVEINWLTGYRMTFEISL